MYVAPKSMSLDLGKMLQADDIQKDVIALGVMWIRIHRAVGLSKQDRRGSKGGGSDPYITLSFSKYQKVTRDRNWPTHNTLTSGSQCTVLAL
jgi:Ca2+-dependent lipid-binding protein